MYPVAVEHHLASCRIAVTEAICMQFGTWAILAGGLVVPFIVRTRTISYPPRHPKQIDIYDI